MNKISIAAASLVSGIDLPSARLGQRFGRLDRQSQLALLATASLKIDFGEFPRERVAICLTASAGSLATDVNFWSGRNGAGGPSPTLFAYTLPSAAAGEIAIHYKLTGPNLVLIGGEQDLLREASQFIQRDEADACLCVFCEVVSAELSALIDVPGTASACAILLKRGRGMRELPEFDRDMKALVELISPAKSLS